MFDRWCSSREVAGEFRKLRQLVLVEEFKACVPVDIKTYIDEQKATTLQQAAVLADDYLLTHRGAFHSPGGGIGSFAGGKDKSSISLNPHDQTMTIIETKLIKGPQEDHVQ